MNHNHHQIARICISVLVLLLSGLVASGYIFAPYSKALEEVFYDARLINSLNKPTSENQIGPGHGIINQQIVIIDIDEKSLSQIGHWPWPRRTVAKLVNTLFDDYQIKVLGFDMVFAEEEENSAQRVLKELMKHPDFIHPKLQNQLSKQQELYQGNVIMAEAITARDAVLGYSFEEWYGEGADYIKKGILSEPIFTQQQISHLDLNFHRAGGHIGNYELLGYAASHGGFFSYPRESSTLRKIPLFYSYEGDIYPSLDLKVALLALDQEEVFLTFSGNESDNSYLTIESVKLAHHDIPVDGKFNVFVPYLGPMYSFQYISASDILTKKTPLSEIKGKIMLLGTSAAGLFDLRSTPVGDSYAGVEVHANVIAGLLDNSFKTYPSYQVGIELVLLLIYTLVLGHLLPKFGAIGISISFISSIALLYLSAFSLWQNFDFILPMANTVLLIFSLTFLHLIYDLFVESKQKKQLSRFFGQYIPAELVSKLNKSGQTLSLTGESREMSVLFSDVRGFTTISEGLDPIELTQLMNEFLTPITRAIHENKGTIDKYMGDAVMAFWGAPLKNQDHASDAIHTAFDMMKAMKIIGPEFKKKGWPEIKIGIGIASGEMRVGNMGSEFRMAYTVLGDTVNLGSRLEGLTKNYGVELIVNDKTACLAPEFEYRELDRVRVKGKNKPVVILEPVALGSQVTEQQLDELTQYRRAMNAYLKQQWGLSEKMFKQLKKRDEKLIYDIYIRRIQDYRATPPPDNWSGVFTHTTK